MPTGTVRVVTASGSAYLVDYDQKRLRREPEQAAPTENLSSLPLRRDGDWITIQSMTELTVGRSAAFMLEPLGDPETTNVTVRQTTPIISIEPVEVAA